MAESNGDHGGTTDDGRPFSELRDSGLLWLINRTALHPRGFALAIHFDPDGNATGWSIKGDGTEPWAFAMDSEEEACFQHLESTLAALRPAAQ